MLGEGMPQLPAGLEGLGTLALDLRWTWSHSGDALWREVDAEIWDQTQNPWFLLQEVSRERLQELAQNAEFRVALDRLGEERRAYLQAQSQQGTLARERIAYFSMEYGLGEAIPLYAGGLGILAGDYLKTASDLRLPIVGVGILFQEGYFRQAIDVAGQQHEMYPYNDPSSLPILPAPAPGGGWLRVPLELPGRTLWLRVWRAQVGAVELYLLDTNLPANSPADRGITTKLYGDGPESRLLQEMVLGIGGFRALTALGLSPSIAHLNEGHAAFAVLERVRQVMQERKLPFREALWATRAGNLFTTHTPVAAGFDRFSPELMAKYFPPFGEFASQLSLGLPELMALGRGCPSDDREPFNMAHLAMRGCVHVNAVSRLHGAVSRRLFEPFYPRWPEAEIPVTSVTNGVHVPTWDSASADALWTDACGKQVWGGSVRELPAAIAQLTDEQLWRMRNVERGELLAYARSRLAAQLGRRGVHPSTAASAGNVLRAGTLTLGFARRFAEYKRPNLLLHDSDRLARLLGNPSHPVQLVIAGKAHPADEVGKRLVAEWIEFVNRPDVRRHALFLEDYDMALAARLVAGVDLWLNTPRRPWEACGTSGMKVLANGGLNLSSLDGWWDEAYAPDVGWALGNDSAPQDDGRDAEQLYALLEQHVVPEFYERDSEGTPRRWLERVRTSMARLTPAFSSVRMLIEYAERFYLEAGRAHRARLEDDAALARALAGWEATLTAHWHAVSVSATRATVRDGELEFLAEASFGALPPDLVRVEVFADALADEPHVHRVMREVAATRPAGPRQFIATVDTRRPPTHFTPRVVPWHPAAHVPSECSFITWAPSSYRPA